VAPPKPMTASGSGESAEGGAASAGAGMTASAAGTAARQKRRARRIGRILRLEAGKSLHRECHPGNIEALTRTS
jgi:hypothetical protein